MNVEANVRSGHKWYFIPQVVFQFLFLFIISLVGLAQTPADTAKNLTLEKCIQLALENNYQVRQTRLDEQIGEYQIRSSLAGYLPQVGTSYNFTHNFQLPTSAFGENLIKIGRFNTSNIIFQANQTLFSNDMLLALRSVKYTRLRLKQNSEAAQINSVVDVTKAFYDILLTQEQVRILNENIARQEKQYRDAYSRYEFGLVDKTDYQRAMIALANTRSDKKRTVESLNSKYAYLKQLIGFPPDSDLTLTFNQAEMEEDAIADTTQGLNYDNRVEVRQLKAQRNLLKLNVSYYRTGFLPTASAFYTHNNMYFNNNLAKLYDRSFPTSQGGLNVSLPLFTGTKRWQNVRIAQLTYDRLEITEDYTKSLINTEYQTALANYKSNYNEYLTLRENVKVAGEVYEIIKLQYDEGIKAYIELIVAETDLKAAQINYLNALYRLLASKMDLERATGVIDLNP